MNRCSARLSSGRIRCRASGHSAELEALGDERVIEGCVDALIRVLADLHAVDPGAVGLADFGKPSGYLERQVRRWGSQWELVRLTDDDRDADVQRLHSALQQSIPQQSRTSIVHGDYRIDNTILDVHDPGQCERLWTWSSPRWAIRSATRR